MVPEPCSSSSCSIRDRAKLVPTPLQIPSAGERRSDAETGVCISQPTSPGVSPSHLCPPDCQSPAARYFGDYNPFVPQLSASAKPFDPFCFSAAEAQLQQFPLDFCQQQCYYQGGANHVTWPNLQQQQEQQQAEQQLRIAETNGTQRQLASRNAFEDLQQINAEPSKFWPPTEKEELDASHSVQGVQQSQLKCPTAVYVDLSLLKDMTAAFTGQRPQQHWCN
eukprot:gnl/TRDRNA2_/TRDRNA2_185022_c0_seq1.p1 gnl/TRDRNA2_/TRDRNA2_185022_c0~~gnl/TRDRNA2_/TRDRNA2_185022_c0_seq1.p1  ORF type:complete len:222 (-),score=47.93 gnl/TRDRNA2_/TRDRNA2_185022_c0_seq1:431-1096(-)